VSRFVFGLVLLLAGLVAALLVRRMPARALGRASGQPVSLAPAGGILALLGLVLAVTSCVKSVPAASVGIPTTFGQIGADLQPGVHFLAPWTDVHAESTRLQQYVMVHQSNEGAVQGDDSITVVSKDDVSLPVDLTINYSVDPGHANELFRPVGSVDNLKGIVIRPAARSAVPAVFARYDADQAATTSRDALAAAIGERLRPQLVFHGVLLDAVQIRAIQLPDSLLKAAQDKLTAQQQVAQAQFTQQQATVDAQTARIRAQGQADANTILAKSLTPEVNCANFLSRLADLKVVLGSTPCAGGSSSPAPVIVNATK